MLTRYKRLIHEPHEAIASIVVIFGLLNLLLLTKEIDRPISALAAFSFIFGWSIEIAYPRIQQGLMHAFNLTPSSDFSRYVVGGADFSFVMAATLGSLLWTNSGQRTANLQVDTRRVPAVIVVATALLSLGELGFLMLAKESIASGTSKLAREERSGSILTSHTIK